jgi:hypothetical protein
VRQKCARKSEAATPPGRPLGGGTRPSQRADTAPVPRTVSTAAASSRRDPDRDHLGTTETLRQDIYNVSSGRPATNREFADALEAITSGVRLDLLPGRRDGPYLDTTRLARTGFRADRRRPPAVADDVAWRGDNLR